MNDDGKIFTPVQALKYAAWIIENHIDAEPLSKRRKLLEAVYWLREHALKQQLQDTKEERR